ncbi:MAG: acetyl-CoA carboxylase biotin carboxyl carrier protein subunit [Pelagibacteraceae bacterium]|nr:acetyl-CoA carboxylase biotin carboxyl carrier protein subunit [Pelagibacteraceae bacterium]PHX88853.1 MAG: acetyl-CoA carboxylase biotin carboxyl carrier protein subunit [Pelagibacteraceae bacterium]
MKIDKNIIKELSNYLKEFNLSEIEISDKESKIKVSRNYVSVNQYNSDHSKLNYSISNEPSTSKEKTKSEKKITSPIIGTAYHASEPGAKKFVEIGKKIKKGDTVMIVEAMKTMNHIPSTADGVVREICVADGQPVEYGQTIVILD